MCTVLEKSLLRGIQIVGTETVDDGIKIGGGDVWELVSKAIDSYVPTRIT